jgi:hypothetical protein
LEGIFAMLDRLRIERLVWFLDQQLYDLPRAQRIAIRREVRANLIEAAHDVGATEALRRVGGSRRLAQQYLVAEFGERPRPSWIGAAYGAGFTPLLLNFFLGEADRAFRDGITAGVPHATGTYVWSGVSWLQSATTYTFTDGTATARGGAWTPLTYVVVLAVVVGTGRLWRYRIRRRPAVATA